MRCILMAVTLDYTALVQNRDFRSASTGHCHVLQTAGTPLPRGQNRKVPKRRWQWGGGKRYEEEGSWFSPFCSVPSASIRPFQNCFNWSFIHHPAMRHHTAELPTGSQIAQRRQVMTVNLNISQSLVGSLAVSGQGPRKESKYEG
jgi:hypothetical protein